MNMSKKVMDNDKKIKDKQMNDKIKAYAPLVTEILHIIGEANLSILEKTDKRPKEAQEANAKIQQLFFDYDIAFADREKIFQLVMIPLNYIKECVMSDTQTTHDRALAKKLGVEDLREMRYSKMIELRDENNA